MKAKLKSTNLSRGFFVKSLFIAGFLLLAQAESITAQITSYARITYTHDPSRSYDYGYQNTKYDVYTISVTWWQDQAGTIPGIQPSTVYFNGYTQTDCGSVTQFDGGYGSPATLEGAFYGDRLTEWTGTAYTSNAIWYELVPGPDYALADDSVIGHPNSCYNP